MLAEFTTAVTLSLALPAATPPPANAFQLQTHELPRPSIPFYHSSVRLADGLRIGSVAVATSLTIPCGDGQVNIDYKTGKVTLRGCTPDEASLAFWQAVERMIGRRPCP